MAKMNKNLMKIALWYILYIALAPGLLLNVPPLEGQDPINNPIENPIFVSSWGSVAVHGIVYIAIGMWLTSMLKM